MSVVRVDIVEGARAKRTLDAAGQIVMEFTRIAVVTGLQVEVGSSDDLFIEAVEAVIVVTGDVGSVHPVQTTAILRDFELESINQDAVRIRINYRDAVIGESAQIEVGTTLTQQETNVDIHGNPMVLTYTPPGGGATLTQCATFMKQVPSTSAIFRRTEAESPLEKSKQYVGKLSSGTFLGDYPRTWMCTEISGVSSDAGLTYKSVYAFQFRPDTWDETSFITDPATGRPPSDVSLGNGMEVFKHYEEDDFDKLGL